ncbi:trichothecene 3-O-acetyltransferase [Corynascus novoguineensis]|uniref:Trichothecene 3-O-acetyltransferase n=1 Tax=Corynascus novoguineensis TaxID=1126955 RepID=A0AAN7HPR9_9PEZI|nr:trichothecene 3-O-acetyltransferase [Corynascus novoguineensis]
MASSTTRTVTLSPLDQYMPRIYTNLFLIFETPSPTLAVEKLRAGLQRLNQHLPYLRGRVFASGGGRVGLRWSPEDKDVELQYMPSKGTPLSELSFAKLKNEGAPLHYFPCSLSPLPRFIDLNSDVGAPVFAVNFARLDSGIVLGLSVQHNVMDGTGVVELVRLWAACTRFDSFDAVATAYPDPEEPLHRTVSLRLATGGHGMQNPRHHQSGQAALSADPFNDLLARHPEFAITPEAAVTAVNPPSSSPALHPGTSRIFTFAASKLEAVKSALNRTQLSSATSASVTTNSILCALIWSCVTRVRTARRGSGNSSKREEKPGEGSAQTSRLGFAVNGRTRLLGGDYSPGSEPALHSRDGQRRPFLGNVNLYGLATMSVRALVQSASAIGDWSDLAIVIDTIGNAIKRVTPQHVAEVMDLVEQAPDTGIIMPGWNSFHRLDLTVTSWANMDLYEADFGEGVGKAEFMRVPRAESDGFALVLPRKRRVSGAGAKRAEEGIEVVLVMHAEDMATLERDAVWASFLV